MLLSCDLTPSNEGLQGESERRSKAECSPGPYGHVKGTIRLSEACEGLNRILEFCQVKNNDKAIITLKTLDRSDYFGTYKHLNRMLQSHSGKILYRCCFLVMQ